MLFLEVSSHDHWLVNLRSIQQGMRVDCSRKEAGLHRGILGAILLCPDSDSRRFWGSSWSKAGSTPKARDGPFVVPDFRQGLYGSVMSSVNRDRWITIYNDPE